MCERKWRVLIPKNDYPFRNCSSTQLFVENNRSYYYLINGLVKKFNDSYIYIIILMNWEENCLSPKKRFVQYNISYISTTRHHYYMYYMFQNYIYYQSRDQIQQVFR